MFTDIVSDNTKGMQKYLTRTKLKVFESRS